jgi:hypothetical protein
MNKIFKKLHRLLKKVAHLWLFTTKIIKKSFYVKTNTFYKVYIFQDLFSYWVLIRMSLYSIKENTVDLFQILIVFSFIEV